jgi:signal transduction histidine kinase
MNGKRVVEASEIHSDIAIESRAYGPSSSPEEVAAIRSRVSWVADGVILLHEIPVQTPFSVGVMFDQLESLVASYDRIHYVADLTDARRPSAEAAASLRERIRRVRPKLDRVAVAVGGNLIIRAMARMMARGIGLPPITVHATRQEAITTLRKRSGPFSWSSAEKQPMKGKAEIILNYLGDIGAGTCSIDDVQIANEPDVEFRQILVGLLVLHGDLEHARMLHERADAERARIDLERERLLSEREAAISARDDFLAVASHELRTPLTTLSLQLETLATSFRRGMGSAPDPTLEERLQRLRRQVARLTDLVAEMLDVSRITSGKISIQEETVNLGQLTREVSDRFEDELARRNTRLTLDAGDSIIGVWDASRLDQVLSNLLSNAIKYGDGKPIEVTAWSADGWAHVSVADRGIGISKDDQDKIFAPFSRAVSSRHISGLGLGLWIAQQIVRSSGGRIRVESKLGSGSRFTIDLPLRDACDVS